MHTAKLLPGKKYFQKIMSNKKKWKTYFDEAPMELCLHDRNWQISY